MFVRRIIPAAFGIVLLGVLTAPATGAMLDTHRTTYFTFSHSVQMPGVELPAGTYAFEVANPDSNSNIVRVLSHNRKKVYLLQTTRFVQRPSTGNLKATVALGETAVGSAQPVRAWYPQDETVGREFIY